MDLPLNSVLLYHHKATVLWEAEVQLPLGVEAGAMHEGDFVGSEIYGDRSSRERLAEAESVSAVCGNASTAVAH